MKNYQYSNKTVIEGVVNAIGNRKYVIKKLYNNMDFYKYVEKKLKEGKELKFIGFWGATNKNKLDNYDKKCIDRLICFISDIDSVYIYGIEWTIIFSDKHAILNGYNADDIISYFKEFNSYIENKKNFNIKIILLSDIWKYNDIDNSIKESMINTEYKDKFNNSDIKNTLQRQCDKYNINNYKSALNYYIMRIVEAKFIEKNYANYIFFSYSTDKLKEIYPECLSIYMWSTRRGDSKAPWLIK